MENEVRYYLGEIKRVIQPLTADEEAALKMDCGDCADEDGVTPADRVRKVFVPQYIVTAVKLPTGAIELAVNHSSIAEKIDYILEAYDENMVLKTNEGVVMQNIMVV